MRTAFLTLFGFLSFTMICPVTMGAMPMDMGDAEEVSHMMQDDGEDHGSTPCEQCRSEKEEVTAAFGTQADAIFASSIPVSFLAYWDLSQQVNIANSQLSLFGSGPPLPAATLVGTVILRT